MKKKLVILLLSFAALFFMGIQSSQAQYMYFCEGVDSDGEPINSSTTFNIPSSGGYLYVLVHNNKAINCTKVRFEIYRNGKYDNTINMSIKPNWDYFYEEVTFYKSGDYDIYAYDCNDREIAYKSLRINYK